MISAFVPYIVNYLSGLRYYDSDFQRNWPNVINAIKTSLLFYEEKDWLFGASFRGFIWASDGIPWDYVGPIRGAPGLSVAKNFHRNNNVFKFNLDVFRTIPLPFLLKRLPIWPGNLYGLQFRSTYSSQSHKRMEIYSDLTYLQNSQLWPKLGLDKGYVYQWQFGCRFLFGKK